MSHNTQERAEVPARKQQELNTALQAVAERVGPNVTLARFVAEAGISHRPVYHWFGSWRQLRIEAGLPPQVDLRINLATYSRDDLLAAMQAAVARHGERLSQHTFCPWPTLRRELKIPARACTGRPLWETNLAGNLFDFQTEITPERSLLMP